MIAKKKVCETCLHFMDDGRCHRFPPSAPVYDASYRFATYYPVASRDGTARLDFPKVDSLMTCGEWCGRWSDEPSHVTTYEELVDAVLKGKGE